MSQNVELKGIHLDRSTFTVMLRVIKKLLILKLLEYDGQLLMETVIIQTMKWERILQSFCKMNISRMMIILQNEHHQNVNIYNIFLEFLQFLHFLCSNQYDDVLQ